MRNIKLTIEYDGTGYNGWQIQRHKTQDTRLKTIQGEIETAIQKITGEHSHLYASGRTDSGVHAKAQIANFHTKNLISAQKLQLALNAVLPKDISIIKAEQVNADFHSRYSAKAKTYCYAILNRPSPSPLIKKFTLHIPFELNLALMRKEAKALLGRHNFRSFEGSGRRAASAVRTIKKITIAKNKEFLIKIDIEADGFLYNMVRNIAGTLIQIGRGKMPAGSMKKILDAQDRKKAGPTAPAHGLSLMDVMYY